MAFLNERNYIGCDISREYVEIAKERLSYFLDSNIQIPPTNQYNKYTLLHILSLHTIVCN